MLISAIMPTAGRRKMAAEAVETWRAQTWPERELVIVDDMFNRSFPGGVSGPGVVYEIGGSMTIGAKRNLACGLASGEVICHWDSDDIYSPDRMEHQANRLTETGADVTGYCPLLFVDEQGRRWQYFGSDGNYAPGTSLMYRKAYWRGRPFNPLSRTGEEIQFLKGARMAVVDGGERCVARIHSQSLTWQGDTPKTEAYLRSQPEWRLVA